MATDGVFSCTVPGCRKRAAVPVKIEVGGTEIVAGKGKTVTEAHISYGSRDTVVGTFMESKKTPGAFGLRNDSSQIWAVNYPGKPMMNYEPGKTVSLIPGTTIEIGKSKITVRS